MRKMLDEKLDRFEELERQMSDPAIQADSARMAGAAREHGSLARVANKYRQFQQLIGQIEEAKQMAAGDDADMAELAEIEMPSLREQREKVWQELLDLTIGGDDANRASCVME